VIAWDNASPFVDATAEDRAFRGNRDRQNLPGFLKAKAGQSVLMVICPSLQMHGAMGYTQEHDIDMHYKRAIALSAHYDNEADQLARFAARTGIAS
jgi:alkylation response protein AidB-like acyl-CoA dehydrogenase